MGKDTAAPVEGDHPADPAPRATTEAQAQAAHRRRQLELERIR
jgi:hypothetical protein